MVAAKPHRIQDTQPEGNIDQQAGRVPKSTPGVQTSVPQPHPVVSEKPIVPPRSGSNIKTFPKDLLPKTSAPCSKW